jgi:biotin carboxyl carrier protein
MLGTFYRAPKPGDRPYCEVGDKVLAGDVLGLVEVMKMMNRVITPVEGEVHLVLAEDGALVEFGQELFEIIPGEERPDPETAP